MIKKALSFSFFTIIIFFYAFDILEAKSPYSKVNNKETFAYIKNAPSFEGSANALVFLLKEEEYILGKDGTIIKRDHIIIKILKDSAKSFGNVVLWYNSYFQTLDVPVARTIKEDGTILNLSPEAVKEAEPFTEYPMYSDIVVRGFSLPQVEPGSVIEYEAIWIQKKHPELMIPFSIFFASAPGLHTLNAELKISIPSGMKTKYEAKNIMLPPPEPKISKKGATDIYLWKLKNIFPIRSFEANQPPYTDIYPYISFTVGESWDEIADWYRGLIKKQAEPDKSIKKLVKELISEEGLSKEEIIKRLYYYVSKNIRYVAIELGMSMYKPYSAEEMLRNGYGDCKAKSSLLIAMLKEFGIPAYFALIKTNNLGDMNIDLPQFNFNHCIIAIPDKEGYIFLDPTSEVNRYKKLPSVVQGVEAFIITENGYKFVKTPVSEANENMLENFQEIHINSDLSAEIYRTGTFIGEEASIRAGFKNMHPEKIKVMLRQLVNADTAAATLENYNIKNIDDLEEPFIIELKYKEKNFCRQVGNMIMFNVPSDEFLDTSLVSDNYRKHPFWFLYVWTQKNEILLELPVGYKIKYLPEEINIDYPFAHYSRSFSKLNGKIQFKEISILKQNYFSAGKYGQLKNMISTISKENKKDIILELEMEQKKTSE